MKKQIILGLLDIEYVFDEYTNSIELMLGKINNPDIEKQHRKISEKYFELLICIFQEIYEALDN